MKDGVTSSGLQRLKPSKLRQALCYIASITETAAASGDKTEARRQMQETDKLR